MSDSIEQFGLRVISGKDRSLRAAIVRGGLRAVEPFYAGAMRVRNVFYDRGIFPSHDLGRPTISVGNITTGGTGKTPVVQWLASQLRARGQHPAILLRGYGSSATQPSDEAQLLDLALNKTDVDSPESPGCLHPGTVPQKIPVMANPSRVEGAAQVLRDHPEVTHFILDDSFQHRKAKRNFDLVLINATEPFGYGHVLPRGLLREPMSGLVRANAFLITRSDLVEPASLRSIQKSLADRHPEIPLYRCNHEQSSIWITQSEQTISVKDLKDRSVYLTAGIGDPIGFERQIAGHGAKIVGSTWWPDHHTNTAGEMELMVDQAKRAGAELLLTTQKDWMKIRSLKVNFPIGVVNVEIRFFGDHHTQLMKQLVFRLRLPEIR